MKSTKLLKVIGVAAGVLLAGSAGAATITCGGPSGIRVTVVDPGLVGGLCATGEDNLQNSDIAALGLTTIDKDVVTDFTPSEVAGGDASEGNLQFSQVTGGRSGTWSIAAAAWSTYEHVYLGFHFGGNQTTGGNPDWFVVELARADPAGTWDLNPDSPNTGSQSTNGALSNIYLLGKDACVTNCGGGGGGGGSAPEPGSLALVGLALLGVGAARKRLS